VQEIITAAAAKVGNKHLMSKRSVCVAAWKAKLIIRL
jgi:hypothetical protein